MFIDDGTGKGFAAKVNADNQLLTKAISREEEINALIEGLDFFASLSAPLNITNAGQNGILYIKNNEDLDLLLKLTNVEIGNTTGGSATANHLLEIAVGSNLAGTLVTAGTVVAASNKNLGSSRLLDADIREAAALLQTITGAVGTLPFLYPDEGKFILSAVTLVPKGQAVAFLFTPKTGNTNLDLNISVDMFLIKQS